MKAIGFVLILFFGAVCIDGMPNGYGIVPERQSVHHLDQMIHQCFQSICKEWMTECHWYCDSINSKNQLKSCKECLSKRGHHCLPCFEL